MSRLRLRRTRHRSVCISDLFLVLLRRLISGVEAGFATVLMRVQEVNWGGCRAESGVPRAACFAHAHVEHPGHPARVAGQERDCSTRCREHAFDRAGDALARVE